MLLLFSAHCFAQLDEQYKRVLVVSPYTSELPAVAIMTRAASERLGQKLGGKVEVFTEFLDVTRFPGSANEQRVATFLSEKYATVRLDVVIAMGPESLQFAVGNRGRIGAGAPLVFCCLSPASLARIDVKGDVSGLVSEYDLAKTMDLAALLQPTARRVVVVAGASEFDKQWEATAKRQLAPYASRYEIRYLSGLPLDQLLNELRSLPRDTIVIFTAMLADGAGKVFPRPRDAVPAITTASSAPVYAPYDTYLDRGIVGGYMDTFETTGVAVADLAMKVLSGEKPPVQSGLASTYRVDWRQLRRWGLSEANLPAGTVVLFKAPSFWEQYYDVALATVAAFALQTAVVAFLLVERRRRQRAEQSLRESEERMGFAAASVNVGLWQYDFAGGKLWATDHCRAMFAIPAEAPLTRDSFLNVVHPDDLPGAQRWMRGVSQSPSATISEFRVLLGNGETRWYLSRAQGRFDDKGSPVRISGAFSDITARKIAESEADAQRQTLTHITRVATVGELSGAIAHEINQPLTAILANAEAARRMLASPQPPLHEIGEALDDIILEDTRADDVIRRLRGMLRKGESRSEPIMLNDLVRSVLRLLRSQLIERRVNVDLDLADDLPEMSGDRVQIQQVLTNLMMNAIDAVTSPGIAQRTITITTTSPQPDHVEIAVIDRGPGLAAGQQARVLEPFFTTKEHGLGLGLAICNSIVNAHGGVLRIANDVDRGVRASFTLPAGRAAARTG